MRADELQRGPLEEQLHQPVRVAEDLGARVLRVVAAARHVVDLPLHERLLGVADVGDLGDRVDGERQRLGAPLGPGMPSAWRIAWRPCSIEVLASAG